MMAVDGGTMVRPTLLRLVSIFCHNTIFLVFSTSVCRIPHVLSGTLEVNVIPPEDRVIDIDPNTGEERTHESVLGLALPLDTPRLRPFLHGIGHDQPEEYFTQFTIHRNAHSRSWQTVPAVSEDPCGCSCAL